MSKTAMFRALLASPELQIVMGAYDALSARIVERAGFGAIWASGLCMSSAIGLRDCNEASVSQILTVLEYMADATCAPILVDGDSGYGNFNNVRQFTRKLERVGVAALCLEDTGFPKTNSFVAGSHELVSIEEFCGKIRAAKDHQTDPDFSVIARTETLVAGRSMSECFDRASAYLESGADGILVHSASGSPESILTFARQWNRRCPLVVVPTSYFLTPVDELAAAGVAMVIWANHTLRAVVCALERLCAHVAATRTVADIEPSITSLSGLFDLLDYDELARAGQVYGPQAPRPETRVASGS